MKLLTITDVACTVCGCVCDDLTVNVAEDRIQSIAPACPLAERWFKQSFAAEPPRLLGREASLDIAIARAAEILNASSSPLIYGLSRSSTDAQRAAVALAEKIGATIDTTASTGHAPSIMALQQVGESTCTLGEVKNRADLILFWGSDPAATHPRHLDRYCPPAAFKVLIHSSAESPTTNLNQSVTCDASWETLWKLRLALRGHPTDLAPEWLNLLARMKACKFGIVFFGAGLLAESLPHRTVEALLQLVTDLNAHTRFYARRMRRYGDVAGADSVLAWQAGFPFGVNFAPGHPRYNPGQFTGPEMLARGEIDSVLFLGSEAARDFPAEAIEQLKRIPVIRLDPPGTAYDGPCEVAIPTAVYGVHKPGTAYRLDEVAIPLKVLLPTTLPSDADVLNRLLPLVASR